jgi:RND family efflux transporter MFP subunit
MRRVSIFLVILGSVSCSSGREVGPPAAPATAITLERAAVQPVAQVLEAGGVVQARTTALITSRIMAPVLSVHAAPGDHVRTGQLLVRLDARDLDAQRQRAAAAADALALGVKAAGADRQGAEAAVQLARTTHQRIAALHERRSATTHELDEAVAALAGAEARLHAADARAAEAEAGLDSARAAANAAVVAASFAAITAPFDGVVTEKLVEPGNLATPGAPLLRVEEDDALRLEVRLDASRAAHITAGQEVEVVLDPIATPAPGVVRGRVVEVARAVDAASQAFLVKIDLPVSPAVRSGTFARARFRGASRDALAIPPSAIVRRGQLPSVFVVQDGRARMRIISTGIENRAHVEVLGGIAAGDSVITAPPPSLRDGDAVRPGSAAGRIEGGR